MNKRWTFTTLALIIIFAALALFMMFPRVKLTKGQPASITFSEGEETRTLSVSGEAADRLRKIVGGHALYSNKPACGFSESFSFSIGERTFYIAQDDCAVLQDAKTKRYVRISEEDRQWIDALFQQCREPEN